MKHALVLLLLVGTMMGVDVKSLQDTYKGKLVVVLRDGLAVGTCANRPGRNIPFTKSLEASLAIRINGDVAEYKEHPETTLMRAFSDGDSCGTILPEPVRKGELLRVTHVGFYRGKYFNLSVENVAPHDTERGIGAFSHRSFERGAATLILTTDDPKKLDAIASDLALWVTPATSELGNTTSGVYVKQVKAGMSVREVEEALGPPNTRIDLADKLLYRYKDLTVEFRDGKVADVR